MKELAFITRVDDRERNEYIQRRIVWKVTEDQLKRLGDLLEEIRNNEGNGAFPKLELFGAEGEVTFKDREWEGQYDTEPKEDEEVFRNNVSLMDYLVDYKGIKHDRYAIVNGVVAYEEDGEMVQNFPGFYNW